MQHRAACKSLVSILPSAVRHDCQSFTADLSLWRCRAASMQGCRLATCVDVPLNRQPLHRLGSVCCVCRLLWQRRRMRSRPHLQLSRLLSQRRTSRAPKAASLGMLRDALHPLQRSRLSLHLKELVYTELFELPDRAKQHGIMRQTHPLRCL